MTKIMLVLHKKKIKVNKLPILFIWNTNNRCKGQINKSKTHFMIESKTTLSLKRYEETIKNFCVQLLIIFFCKKSISNASCHNKSFNE